MEQEREVQNGNTDIKKSSEQRLLIVEDEYLICENLRVSLIELGYVKIEVAIDEKEALQQIQDFKPDIVLLDIQLGNDFGGLKIAEELRYRFAIPFIFLTSHTSDKIVDQAKKYQPYGYLIKPAQKESLRITLELALYKAAYENISNQERERKLLLDLIQAFASVRKREELLEVITETLRAIFPFEDAIISIWDEDGNIPKVSIIDSTDTIKRSIHFQELANYSYQVEGTPYETIWSNQRPSLLVLHKIIEEYPDFPVTNLLIENNYKQNLIIPLWFQGERVGVLELLSQDKNYQAVVKQINQDLVEGVSNQIAITLSNILANEKIKESENAKSFQIQIINVLNQEIDQKEKYFRLIRILQPTIPFDLIAFGLNYLDKSQNMAFERIGFDEYRFLTFDQVLDRTNYDEDYIRKIIADFNYEKVALANDAEFVEQVNEKPLLNMVNKFFNINSYLNFSFKLNDGNLYWIIFYSKTNRIYKVKHLNFLHRISPTIASVIEKQLAYVEIEKLNRLLKQEKIYLEEEIKTNYNFEEIIGSSDELQQVLKKVSQVAFADTSVLISGESGTGKELIARSIHNLSPRKGRPLIKLNCATLPAQLIESELFGHEKGSFTGAIDRRIGKFELANEGTIFLDEIGELPIGLQAKLLRVLQEKEFERLGGNQTIKTNVRIITATNRDLESEIEKGKFRSDLYYRLNVFPIVLPPLRHRKEDITALALHFLQRSSVKLGKKILGISSSSLKELLAYDWPGNIRELEHVIERSVLLNEGSTLQISLDKPTVRSKDDQHTTGLFRVKTLKDAERELIMNTLKFSGGKVRGVGGAAELLDIHPATLDSRMKKLGIKRSHVFEAK